MAQRNLRAKCLFVAGGLFLALPALANALSNCGASVRPANGVIQVNADNVSTNLRWGPRRGDETRDFANGDACISTGLARNCRIGKGAASKTPPTGCTVYLRDDTSRCEAWIPGCTPGVRPGDAGDPLIVADANGLLVGFATDNTGGSVMRRTDDGTLVTFYAEPDGVFEARAGGFNFSPLLYYAAPSCAEPAMISTRSARAGFAWIGLAYAGKVYFPADEGAPVPFRSGLYLAVSEEACANAGESPSPGKTTVFTPPDRCCVTYASDQAISSVAAARSFDVSNLVPPFHLEGQQVALP